MRYLSFKSDKKLKTHKSACRAIQCTYNCSENFLITLTRLIFRLTGWCVSVQCIPEHSVWNFLSHVFLVPRTMRPWTMCPHPAWGLLTSCWDRSGWECRGRRLDVLDPIHVSATDTAFWLSALPINLLFRTLLLQPLYCTFKFKAMIYFLLYNLMSNNAHCLIAQCTVTYFFFTCILSIKTVSKNMLCVHIKMRRWCAWYECKYVCFISLHRYIMWQICVHFCTSMYPALHK